MAKYGKKAQETVEEAMHKMKKGQLKSGSGGKVKNPRQAIAIGLSEARKKGAKVPPKKGAKKAAPKKAGRKSASKKSAPKKGAAKKGTRKSATRKSAPKKATSKSNSSRKSAA